MCSVLVQQRSYWDEILKSFFFRWAEPRHSTNIESWVFHWVMLCTHHPSTTQFIQRKRAAAKKTTTESEEWNEKQKKKVLWGVEQRIKFFDLTCIIRENTKWENHVRFFKFNELLVVFDFRVSFYHSNCRKNKTMDDVEMVVDVTGEKWQTI